jgi:hypothetical protein
LLERPRRKKQGRVRRRKLRKAEMTFTGNLIEDLMATVERAERRTASVVELSQVEPTQLEPVLIEPWFVSVQENADYDSKFLGVA